MPEDSWRPFDGVDFSHESAIDQAGFVKNLISVTIMSANYPEIKKGNISLPFHARVSFPDDITYAVMLQGEQCVQELETNPPVITEPSLHITSLVTR
jgi:hypothetical protein